MKKSAFVLFGTLVLSSQVFSADLMSYPLNTAGERNAEPNRVLLDERSSSYIEQSLLEAQLTTSDEKSSTAMDQIDLYSQETYNALLEYHIHTIY